MPSLIRSSVSLTKVILTCPIPLFPKNRPGITCHTSSPKQLFCKLLFGSVNLRQVIAHIDEIVVGTGWFQVFGKWQMLLYHFSHKVAFVEIAGQRLFDVLLLHVFVKEFYNGKLCYAFRSYVLYCCIFSIESITCLGASVYPSLRPGMPASFEKLQTVIVRSLALGNRVIHTCSPSYTICL